MKRLSFLLSLKAGSCAFFFVSLALVWEQWDEVLVLMNRSFFCAVGKCSADAVVADCNSADRRTAEADRNLAGRCTAEAVRNLADHCTVVAVRNSADRCTAEADRNSADRCTAEAVHNSADCRT